MKYLFTYAYKGKNQGLLPETGRGSAEMITTETDKITPKVIESACDVVRKDLESNGIHVDNIAPMGWFKYDEEDEA